MSELDRIVNRHRRELLRRDQETLTEMARRWRGVQEALEPQMELLVREIQEQRLRRTSLGQIARLERYQTLLSQVEVQLGQYSEQVAPDLLARQLEYVQLGLFDASQYFDAAAMAGFNRLPVQAIEIAIGYAADGTPLQQLLAASWPDATDQLTQTLINGLGEGTGPRELARRMSRATGASLTRMQTIARTETLRAYRTASHQQYRSAGVEEWIRVEAMDRRTCPGCLALDGKRYPMDEPPFDHPNGRMTLIPDVGLERGQSMQEWFRSQPEEQQREQLLSPRRYTGLVRGDFAWEDMAKVVNDPVWGKSVQVRPLSELGV